MNNTTTDVKKTDIQLILKLAKYLFMNRLFIIIAFATLVLEVVFGVLLPFLSSIIIDEYILKEVLEGYTIIIFLYFSFYVLSTVFGFIGGYLFSLMGENAVYELRKDTFDTIQSLSIDYFDETATGDTISRMTNDLDQMQPILSGQIVHSIFSFILVVCMFLILFTISPALTILSLISLPIILGTLYVNNKYVRPRRETVNKKIAKVSASMTENIMGAKVSKSYAREELNIKDFKVVNDDYINEYLGWYKIGMIFFPLFLLYSLLMLFFILTFSSVVIYLQLDLGLTIGTIYLFIVYSQRFFGPISNLSFIYSQSQTALAAFSRINTLNERESSVPDSPSAKELIVSKGEIIFENVAFRYNKVENHVLDQFNLFIRPNEKIAIVGATGSGKSTIANLLIRLYEINEGCIVIDNQDIQNVTKESLRSTISMVPQDPFLFSESIRYNLCYAIENECTDEILKNVLILVGAEFVFQFEDGLNTNVGERGCNLSMGQRQLLTFARALLKDPKILILDEATSSIDPQTELQIQKAMDKMLQNRTSIIIAHRLSTVTKADRIIVIDQGKIVEDGTFKELLDNKGEFFDLYRLQIKNNNQKLISPEYKIS